MNTELLIFVVGVLAITLKIVYRQFMSPRVEVVHKHTHTGYTEEEIMAFLIEYTDLIAQGARPVIHYNGSPTLRVSHRGYVGEVRFDDNIHFEDVTEQYRFFSRVTARIE